MALAAAIAYNCRPSVAPPQPEWTESDIALLGEVQQWHAECMYLSYPRGASLNEFIKFQDGSFIARIRSTTNPIVAREKEKLMHCAKGLQEEQDATDVMY